MNARQATQESKVIVNEIVARAKRVMKVRSITLMEALEYGLKNDLNFANSDNQKAGIEIRFEAAKQIILEETKEVNEIEESVYLVDGTNNNKVVNEFDSKEDAVAYVNAKEFSENWENSFETFEDFKEEFFTVTTTEMNEAIRTKGSRVKNYWN